MTDRRTELTVDAFLDAVRTAFDNAGQIVPWPLHVARISPHYGDLEAADLVARLSVMRAEGRSPADIAGLYPSASSAKSLLLDLVPGMKDAGVPAPRRVEFVETVFAGLAEVEAGDVFCRDGAHRLLNADGAAQLVDGLPWTPVGSGDVATAAYGLSGALQTLVWSIHFYGWTDISFVIHGPYPVTGPDGRPATLVVRDFFDIAPKPVWPQLPDPPCRTARICSLHDDTDAFRMDIFNHLLHHRALLSSTTAVSVEVDGVASDRVDGIAALRAALVAIARSQKGLIDGLDEREVATKFVESRYYAFRRWRAAAGDDWRPPPEVYRRLRDLPLPAPPPGNAPWAVLRDIFDPRVDWPVPAHAVPIE